MKDRFKLISIINNPISFIVLVLLMVESLLGTMAYNMPEYTGVLICAIISFFSIFTIIVVALGIWKPEALNGTGNWNKIYSKNLADNIYDSVEGYFENLSKQEKIEAWMTVSDYLKTEDSGSVQFNNFCKEVGGVIERRAQLNNQRLTARGRI